MVILLGTLRPGSWGGANRPKIGGGGASLVSSSPGRPNGYLNSRLIARVGANRAQARSTRGKSKTYPYSPV